MTMHTQKKNWFKFTLTLLVCLLFRLIPFRPPNIEPLLTAGMPISQAYGPYVGFLFGFSSIFIYDIFTSGIGAWTWITGIAYGIIAFGASQFFKNRKGTASNYAVFAILATIFFDIITGLTVGPLFFNQPFLVAVVGQIPFTLMHLVGNVSFAVILSPSLHAWISKRNASNFSFIPKFSFRSNLNSY